ncbi:hypothetical protein [Streptomyces sp.]|uniref:hypothetical protein n=1 Tax=Streptomyces sp. TaxID=1931 RepID=UPI002F41AA53
MFGSEGVAVHVLEPVLGDVLSTPGVSGAAVIDSVTGLSYAEAGDCTAAGSGNDICDLVNLISDRLRDAGAEGELESVVVTGTRTHHIVQVVPRRGDAVLLSTVLDRRGSNLALAMRGLADGVRTLLG